MAKYNSYNVNLSIDTINSFLKSEVNFTYYCKEEKINSLNFFIFKDLNIKSIKSNNIADYRVKEKIANWSPFIKESKEINIYFSKPLVKGEKVYIKFNYSGQIKNLGINRITEKWIELGIYSPWFPLIEKIHKACFKVNISFKKDDYFVVGSNITKPTENGWLINQKIPFIDCSFLASKYFNNNQFKNKVKEVDVQVFYIDNSHKIIAKELNDISHSILNSFVSKFGDIKKQNFSIVILPREDGGGYNRPGLIVLPNLSKENSTNHFKYLSGKIKNYKYLAHEMAHLWWSKADMTTYEDWLNESFAEYSCLISIRDYYGKERFEEIIDKYKENSKDLPPILNLDREDEKAFDTLYVKGPILLYELEKEMGERMFNKLLCEIHMNEINNTEEFLNKLLEITNKETMKKFKSKLKS
ncbi:MAG: M1 family metallopeptidase [Firmicutes bacterium]|nr:M1 family metallopeptidase [Bacillota bacterium]